MFGQLLAWHRRRLSLTQEELAVRAGLSDRTIRSLEAGRGRSPRPVSVRLLADALGLIGSHRAAFIASAGPDATAPVGADARPAQLPAAPYRFVGRDEVLAELDALGRADAGATVVISAIEGLAGVGKTALALRWASTACDAFPDGQLYLNLRGFSGETPVRPLDGLTQLLRALRVPTDEVSMRLDEVSARFRTAVADRRMLILLDDAADAEQVRPLLPGPSRCVVVVTSRNRLGGLTAFEGAHRITLPPLSPEEALAVLGAFVGDARIEREREAAAAVAKVCDYLPLALRIAAVSIVDRPRGSIAAYLREATAAGLSALTVPDDPQHGVQIAFDISYTRLPAAAARMFRLLSLAPGPSAGIAAAATLAGLPVEETLPLMQTLVDAHLVEEPQPGRYTMHDLIAQHARGCLAKDETNDERRAAVTRILDWYLTAFLAAFDLISLSGRVVEIVAPDPPADVPFVRDRAAALAFLDAERPNLGDLLNLTEAEGAHQRTWQLACLIGPYFFLRGDSPESLALYLAGQRAADLAGNHQARATLFNNAGIAYATMRDLPEATEQLQQAVAAWHAGGNPAGAVRTLSNVGTLYFLQRRFEDARAAYTLALQMVEDSGDTRRIGRLLNNLGGALIDLGETDEALQHLERSCAMHRENGDQAGEADALDNLGRLYLATGDLDAALRTYRTALDVTRAADYKTALGNTLAGIGHVYRERGDTMKAIEHLVGAADGYRRVHNWSREVEIRRELGDLYAKVGMRAAANAERQAADDLERRRGAVTEP